MISDEEPRINDTEMSLIRAAFDRFRNAVLAGDTTSAIDALTASSVQQYERYREAALSANMDGLTELPIHDLVMVLGFRHSVGGDLADMAGRQLLAHAMETDWIRGDQLAEIELVPRRASENSVMCEGLLDGRRTLMQFGFVRERDGWKYDYTSMNPNSQRMYSLQARQSGLSDVAYVLTFLGEAFEEPIPDSIWNPVTPLPR